MLQEEIVRLLQADPARGLQEAIDQYAALVRRIILAKIGAARHADAEELTSDVFYTLFCSRTQIDLQKGSLTARTPVCLCMTSMHTMTRKTMLSIAPMTLRMRSSLPTKAFLWLFRRR